MIDDYAKRRMITQAQAIREILFKGLGKLGFKPYRKEEEGDE